jgi:hypothetical protein
MSQVRQRDGFAGGEEGPTFGEKILGLLEVSRLPGRGFRRRLNGAVAIISKRDVTLFSREGRHRISPEGPIGLNKGVPLKI